MKYFSGISGLKAIACLLVVGYHLNQQRPNANLDTSAWEMYQFIETFTIAVSFFFLVSGIFTALKYIRARENQETAPFPLADIITRKFRIIPAFLAALCISWGIEIALFSGTGKTFIEMLQGALLLGPFFSGAFFPSIHNGPLWYIAFDIWCFVLTSCILWAALHISIKGGNLSKMGTSSSNFTRPHSLYQKYSSFRFAVFTRISSFFRGSGQKLFTSETEMNARSSYFAEAPTNKEINTENNTFLSGFLFSGVSKIFFWGSIFGGVFALIQLHNWNMHWVTKPEQGILSEWFGMFNIWIFTLHYLAGAIIAEIWVQFERFKISNHWIFDIVHIGSWYGLYHFLWEIRMMNDYVYSFPYGPFHFPNATIYIGLIVATVPFTKIVSKMLDTPIFLWISKHSYSIYLIHGIVIATVLHYMSTATSNMGDWWQLVAYTLFITPLFAYMLYRFVESVHWQDIVSRKIAIIQGKQ